MSRFGSLRVRWQASRERLEAARGSRARRWRVGALLLCAASVLFASSVGVAETSRQGGRVSTLRVEPKAFAVVQRDSGPVNYYRVVEEAGCTYVRSAYRPPYQTTVLGYAVPEKLRRSVRTIRWRWRALTLPRGGNECEPKNRDSAATVYLTWKRGLRWYTLKYAWSSVAPKGAVCDEKRNPFLAQETIIAEAGGPTGAWKSMAVDLAAEFRSHFAPDDPDAKLPDFGGIGIMSDGDQTGSASEADFGDFEIDYLGTGKDGPGPGGPG